MAKFTPALDAAVGKMKDYQAVVTKLKKNLEEKTSEIVAIMLTKERTDAMSLVGTALEMEGALTDQQYFRLLRDVDHFLGEQSLVFRHLAKGIPSLEIQPQVRAMFKTCARKSFYSRKDSRLEKGFEDESVLAKFPFLRGRSDPSTVPHGRSDPSTLPQDVLNPLLGASSGLSALNSSSDLLGGAAALPPIASVPPSGNAHSRNGSLIGSETGSTRELPGFGSTFSGLTPEEIPDLAGISKGDQSTLADIIPQGRDDVNREAIPGKAIRSLSNAPSMRQLVSSLPPQAIRGGMIGKHIHDIRGVGDGLLLAIAW